MYPRERRRKVFRRELWSKQPMHDHRDTDNEERNLKQRARVPLFEQAADDGNAQQIELTTTQTGATPLISNWCFNFVPSWKVT